MATDYIAQPFSAVAQPHVAAYTITGFSRTSNVATVTVSTTHAFGVGQVISISSTTDGTNNVDATSATVTAVTQTTISYASTGGNISATSPTGTGTVLLVTAPYASIALRWTKPTGTWYTLLLVRNSVGFAVSPDDGDLLLSVSNAGHDSLVSPYYVDEGQAPYPTGLISGGMYYYSLFVSTNSGNTTWVRAGDAKGLSVKDYGTASTMYSYLPLPYRLSTTSVVDNGVSTNTDLVNFLSVFSFEYNLLRSLVDIAKDRYNLRRLDATLVSLLLKEFGLNYEDTLGVQQARRMLNAVVGIYQYKGTSTGIQRFISAYAGYDSNITFKNLMLNNDDASFESGVGNWKATTACTLTRLDVAGATAEGLSPALAPYNETSSPAGYPNQQNGLLKVTVSGTSASFSNAFNQTSSVSDITKPIPVTAGQVYSFSVYSRAKTNGRATALQISWLDATGASISTQNSSGYTSTNSGWTRLSYVNKTAPANAAFVGIKVLLSSTVSGEIFYFDAFQVEQSATATTYADARRLDIYLNPSRVNIVPNPSFEVDTSSWTTTGTTSFAVTAPGTGALTGSTKSGRIVAAGSAVTLYASTYQALNTKTSGYGLRPHTFSAYFNSATADVVTPKIFWYDSSNTLLATTVGTPVTLGGSAWTRVSVTGTAPISGGTTTATKVVYWFDIATAVTRIIYVDCVLFEASPYLQPYFDATIGYYQTADLATDSGINTLGRSLYYKNKANAVSRLNSAIADYLPIGTTYALYTGQSY